jgi:ATP-dependent helicase/nuclease subunit B
LPGEYKSLEERWTHLRHAREILSARRDRQASGEFEGILEKASSSLQERYGGDGPWSASSLGTYAKCPFLFLVNNTLELEAIEPPELGMDALQMGSMLHSILEHAYADASDPADPDVVMESLHKTAEKEFSEAPRKYGFRPSALWDIEQDQILEKLETTIELLTGDDGWKPIAFEARFGLGGKPPLLVDIGGENIRLRGVIDRVDRNSDGQLRVIDYKTGGTYLKSDLEKGVLLQLPLYALAAREVLKLGTPVSGFYWVINKGEARLKLKEVSNKVSYGIEDSIEIMRKSLEKSINGIRSAKFPPIPPEGGCPFYCPAALWCWRYEGGWSP